jgi:hypothetical protein
MLHPEAHYRQRENPQLKPNLKGNFTANCGPIVLNMREPRRPVNLWVFHGFTLASLSVTSP